MSKLEEQLQDLVERNWTVLVHRGEDGYLATVAELPGCATAAESWGELDGMIREAIAAWIESALEHGDPIPSPRSQARGHSGRFVVRTSPSLHGAIARRAASEGVSMNQWIVEQLAGVAGRPV
ncbi:MAG: toxin-antitoxin system HicB family antitoxin [Pseudonocardiales bacterium]